MKAPGRDADLQGRAPAADAHRTGRRLRLRLAPRGLGVPPPRITPHSELQVTCERTDRNRLETGRSASATDPKAAILDDPKLARNRLIDCRRRDLGDGGEHDEYLDTRRSV